jgi:hypothetical protein
MARSEWLAEKLAYIHEPSLGQRLKDALRRCPMIAATLIGTSEQRSAFIRKVVVTRHFETHLDPDNEAAAARGAPLVTLAFQLRALVEMTLLLELGFSCDEVAAIFDREGSRYRRVEILREQQ